MSSSCQPGKAEIEEDLRVNATFEEAVQDLARTVRVRYAPRTPPKALMKSGIIDSGTAAYIMRAPRRHADVPWPMFCARVFL